MKFQETKNKIQTLWEDSQQTAIDSDKVNLTFPSLIIDRNIRKPKFYETNWVNLSINSQSVQGDINGEYPISQSVSCEVDLTIKEEFLPFVNPSILIDSKILEFTSKSTTKIMVEDIKEEYAYYYYADGELVFRGRYRHFYYSSTPWWTIRYRLVVFPNEIYEKDYQGNATFIKYPLWDSSVNGWICCWDSSLLYPIGFPAISSPRWDYSPPSHFINLNCEYKKLCSRLEVIKEETNETSLCNSFPNLQINWIKLGTDKFRLKLSGSINVMTKVISTSFPYINSGGFEGVYNYYEKYPGDTDWFKDSVIYPTVTTYSHDYNTEAIQGESLRMKLLVGIEPPNEFNEVKNNAISRK